MGVNTLSVEHPKLTVWVRAGGNTVKSSISSFVQQVLRSLPQNVPSKILVCTNPDDVILPELDTVAKTWKAVKPVFAQLSSFSLSLTTLAQNTDPESDVLTLSVGVNIRRDQIETGLQDLTDHVKVYGWEVTGYGNNGSCPGRGWYNTAALIHRTIVGQMREGIPRWVDNGVLEAIGGHVIGGSEEVPIMVEAVRRDPDAEFILNRRDPVSSSIQLGTGISFQATLARRVTVGLCYMQKLHREYSLTTDFKPWQAAVWDSLKVIRPF